jgi:hypothetical protein
MPFDVSHRLSRAERDAARGALAKARAERVVGHLCAITRLALSEGRIVTPLAYEALFRQVIRSELCLQGWRWTPADQVASDLVAVVLNILQVKRPSWNEGQREWTVEGGTLIERTRCAHCGNKLQEGQLKFCGKPCRNVYHLRQMYMRQGDEAYTSKKASAWEL